MFSRNVQFAPGGRNNRRQPRRSVREASDDRGFNGSGWPDFNWENGDISALPGRSCFPTDASDHRCIRRRCPESLPLPRHRSHKYINQRGSTLEEIFMHAYRCAKEYAIDRAFYKSFRLMGRYLLLGLTV